MSEEERIARLEAKVAVMQSVNKEQTDLLKEIKEGQDELRRDWLRARGVIAGVMLTISAIISVISLTWSFLKGGNS